MRRRKRWWRRASSCLFSVAAQGTTAASWMQRRTSASCGWPSPKGPCIKRVSFNFACKNHFAHILYEPHRLHKAKALLIWNRMMDFFSCGFQYLVGEEEAEEALGDMRGKWQHCRKACWQKMQRLPGSGLCQPIRAQVAMSANQSELRQPAVPTSQRAGSKLCQAELRQPALF